MPRLAKRKLRQDTESVAESENEGALKEITNNQRASPSSPKRTAIRKKPKRDMTELLRKINEEHQKENEEINSAQQKKEGEESKKKKNVGFISSQPTEVIPFVAYEPVEVKLETIVMSDRPLARPLMAMLPAVRKPREVKPSSIVEFTFDDDDEEEESMTNMFSIHNWKQMVQVTKDTETMTMGELRAELAERKISATGTKEQLIERLEKAIKREMASQKRQKRTTRRLKKESEVLEDCTSMF